MRIPGRFLVLACVLLALAARPPPTATADHICAPDEPMWSCWHCEQGGLVCDLLPPPDADPYRHCPHASPHGHAYGSGGSAGARSATAMERDDVGVGFTSVWDTNVADCDGDGIAGDFDGDHETGVGGGFFGYGPWADEPACTHGLRTHGAMVVVSDAVWGNQIAFVIGADDTSGPVVEVDPVDGSTSCSTDGSITPGDPATDPTADPDDCLSEVYVGTGSTCGAGGDGGYWVFLSGVLLGEDAGGVSVANAPTSGTLTA